MSLSGSALGASWPLMNRLSPDLNLEPSLAVRRLLIVTRHHLRGRDGAVAAGFFPGHVGATDLRARPPPRQARHRRVVLGSPLRLAWFATGPRRARRRLGRGVVSATSRRWCSACSRASPSCSRSRAWATASSCRGCSAGTSTRTTSSSSPSSSPRTSRRRSSCFGFFLEDWMRIVARPLAFAARTRDPRRQRDARLGWLLVVGTIPAGLLGLLLEHALRALFASPRSRRSSYRSTA